MYGVADSMTTGVQTAHGPKDRDKGPFSQFKFLTLFISRLEFISFKIPCIMVIAFSFSKTIFLYNILKDQSEFMTSREGGDSQVESTVFIA